MLIGEDQINYVVIAWEDEGKEIMGIKLTKVRLHCLWNLLTYSFYCYYVFKNSSWYIFYYSFEQWDERYKSSWYQLVDKGKPGEGAVLCFPGFLETSLDVIIGLIKDCIKGIHLLDNKRFDSRKLIQTKLAFSFEQTILLAKLAHHCLAQRTDGNPLHFTLLKHCTECIRNVLGDTNMQVILHLLARSLFSPFFMRKSCHCSDYCIFSFTGSSNWLTSAERHVTERNQCRGH